jgi:hypothetical protein
MQYAKPDPNATIFNEWRAIPAIQDSTGIFTLAQITQNLEAGTPEGTLRQTYWDVSFKLDKALISFITNKFYALLPTIMDAQGLLPTAAIQPITRSALTAMQKNGGNALGLSPEEGPYFIFNLAIMWADIEDEPRMLKFCADLVQAAKEEARRLGADNDYVYMNYASQFQDPIASYGEANVARLREVAQKYDPRRVFQELQPGYFKLGLGAPDRNMP